MSRPSDALAARGAANRAFTGLLLALGGVALLVGGVGVANTMVISVLERRAEIGLRRALGAIAGLYEAIRGPPGAHRGARRHLTARETPDSTGRRNTGLLYQQ